jgi:hypothetical protein
MEGSSDSVATGHLDFIVIGAQKAGTTSLWQYLRPHPRLHLARSKEAPFFSTTEADHPGALDEFMRVHFGDAPDGALLGKATTSYMMGCPGAGIEQLVKRISAALPDVKLLALLRDPIERAVSGYTMAVRRGKERRSVDAAMSELLEPAELARSRLDLTLGNSYVVLGEYGRILGAYRSAFPADRFLIAYSEDLARDPGSVIDTVLVHLDLDPGFRPQNLGVRYFRSGTRKRLDPEAERQLSAFLVRDILPQMNGDPERHMKAFSFFYETWNVIPDEAPPQLSAELRGRLEAHFAADAELLADLGIRTPWLAAWERRGER